jgi:hypothetical protein
MDGERSLTAFHIFHEGRKGLPTLICSGMHGRRGLCCGIPTEAIPKAFKNARRAFRKHQKYDQEDQALDNQTILIDPSNDFYDRQQN